MTRAAEMRADSLTLQLEVADPEVVTELGRYEEGEERHNYALAGLRLGVLALRQARGELDATTIRHEGDLILGEMRRALLEHTSTVTGGIAASLQSFLDPTSGSLPIRLEKLIKRDGDLDALLASHLGTENSILARTLAAAVGENSPLFRLLSPTQADGLLAGMTTLMHRALDEHGARVTQEFSLDRPDSALSRLVRGLIDQNGQLRADLRTDVDGMVRQFSLDDPGSALSRLVREVTRTSQAITQEFSLDLEDSALNRMRRELLSAFETMAKTQADFQTEVRTTLETFRARRDEAARSTRHGVEYEDLVCEVLGTDARRLGDIFTECGRSVGRIKNSKAGDATAELGPDSATPGARIVIEAKAEKGYSVEAALRELRTARDNRDARVGIFVLARRAATGGLESLSRFGDDIFVIWDESDPTSDVFLGAAYSLARAMVITHHRDSSETEADFEIIDVALLEIQKKSQSLEEIVTSAQTVQNAGDKILTRARIVRDSLLKEVEILQEQLTALRKRGSV